MIKITTKTTLKNSTLNNSNVAGRDQYIITSKEKVKLDLTLKDGHGIPFNMPNKLNQNNKSNIYLLKRFQKTEYEENEFQIGYALSIPEMWHLEIKNSGETHIDKIRVEILIKDVCFDTSSHCKYESINHIRGIGGFAGLKYTIRDLKPDESSSLPEIPFENSRYYMFDTSTPKGMEKLKSLDSLTMIIKLFLDNEKVKEYSYPIDVFDEGPTRLWRMVTNEEKSFKYYHEYKLKPNELIKNISQRELKELYQYYVNLKPRDIENPTYKITFKPIAKFLGMLYYKSHLQSDEYDLINIYLDDELTWF